VLPLQYASKGSLSDALKNEPVDEKTARYIFKQILQNVEFIHNFKVAHRDLKPENILINSNFQMCLTDFGYANIGSNPSYLALGTSGYIND